MNKPVETIDERLSRIEILMLDLKNQPKTVVQQNETEQLLTLQEPAQLLNHTVSNIYVKVSKGELSAIKRSKCLYFSLTELMGYIKRWRKRSKSEIEKQAEAEKKRGIIELLNSDFGFSLIKLSGEITCGYLRGFVLLPSILGYLPSV